MVYNSEYRKKYYQLNHEKIKEHRRRYLQNNYEKIKQKFSEKVKCSCGRILNRSSLPKHKKTKTHETNLKMIVNFKI